MAYVEYNLPCPECNGTSSYGIDDGGWGRCFKCGHNGRASTEASESSTGRVVYIDPVASHTEAPVKPQSLIYKPIVDRKLDIHTCEKYKVGWKGDDLYFTYGDAAKVRKGGDKQFTIVNPDAFKENKKLFGQDVFAAGGKSVLVVEGEFDALAAHQMLGSSRFSIAVVSIRNGAQSALKDCKENFDWLDSFGEVVFCLDNDPDGHNAQMQCAELFSHKSKCMVAVNGYKDACDFLKENQSQQFVDNFWRAERYVPDGIVAGDSQSLLDAVMKPIERSDVDYPFAGLNTLTYGIRQGELVTVTAGSGLGKSQFLREIIWHILNNTDGNVGLMFLEESTRKTGLSLMSLAANKPLHLPDTEATEEEKLQARKRTLETGRLFLFDHFGSTEIDNIVNRVRYLAKVMDCRYVFLDHISIVVSAQTNGDERKALDEIVTKLRMLVQETGVALIAVSHLKRPDTKGHEEGAATSLAQLRGSGSIAQLSDMVIGLERNGQAEDVKDRNTTRVRVLKNRFSGITGPACSLLYSHDTGRMSEVLELEETSL